MFFLYIYTNIMHVCLPFSLSDHRIIFWELSVIPVLPKTTEKWIKTFPHLKHHKCWLMQVISQTSSSDNHTGALHLARLNLTRTSTHKNTRIERCWSLLVSHVQAHAHTMCAGSCSYYTRAYTTRLKQKWLSGYEHLCINLVRPIWLNLVVQPWAYMTEPSSNQTM